MPALSHIIMTCLFFLHMDNIVFPNAYMDAPIIVIIIVCPFNLNISELIVIGRRILLHFEAVDSAFIAWVNGIPIGYRYDK